MLNNTYTSSLPKLSAQGSLAHSNESNITVKTGDKQGESFDSVLSRQMEANPAADNLPADSKTTTDTAADEKEQNVALATLPDQASNPLTALLLANHELKAAHVPDSKAAANELSAKIAAPADSDEKKTVGSELDGKATVVSELHDKTIAAESASKPTAPPELNGVTTAVSALNSNTIAAGFNNRTSATELNDKATTSAIDTPDRTRTAPARDKSDALITSSGANTDISTQPGLRGEPLKATELSNSLPSAMQASQALTQAGTSPGLQPNATPGSNSATLTTPLGHSAWPAEFSQKVSWISTQKNQVAELHLNPPDLGPINIVLKISDNQATALFTSPHSAVRDAIENAMPKLRESLAENGITLGQATVSDQTPRDNSSAHFMNQRAHSRTTTEDTAPKESALASLPLMTARQHKGMIDTFA
ncbi:MAG: flagellar hook-length control protein FliK [Gallionella sp.]|nr:flagellar hook-length control protein FliK [Gallionella sp.]